MQTDKSGKMPLAKAKESDAKRNIRGESEMECSGLLGLSVLVQSEAAMNAGRKTILTKNVRMRTSRDVWYNVLHGSEAK